MNIRVVLHIAIFFYSMAAVGQSPVHSLSAIGSEQPSFVSAVEQNFPGITSKRNFSALRSSLLLLTNDGTVPAISYSVVWETFLPGHAPRKMMKSFVLLHQMRSSESPRILPGAARLVGPHFNLTPEQYKSIPDFEHMFPDQNPPDQGATTTRTVLAAVIFADRRMLGNDLDNLETRFTAERSAEHDEGAFVMSKLRSNVPMSAILAILKSQITFNPSDYTPAPQSLYVHARAIQAGQLTGIYETQGTVAFQQAAKRMAAYPMDPKIVSLN
jgi:hypothetical protein